MFTPIQSRMLRVLSDGMPHTPQELHACLDDDLGPIKNISAHITAIRKKLRSQGEDVICQQTEIGSFYRLVRLLASPYDGSN